MKYLLPLAKPENYVPFAHGYHLKGKNFLAIPGCVADDPELGAQMYNQNLLQRHAFKNAPKRRRVKILFLKYPTNRRVQKIKGLIDAGTPFELKKLTRTEALLLVASL